MKLLLNFLKLLRIEGVVYYHFKSLGRDYHIGSQKFNPAILRFPPEIVD